MTALARMGLVLAAGVLWPLRGLELRDAAVVCPPGLSGPETRAVQMLVEEVEKRSQVRWRCLTNWPGGSAPVILVCPATKLAALAGEELLPSGPAASGPESFRLWVRKRQDRPVVLVIGEDARGVLFGVGRLLRELRMRPGTVQLAEDLRLGTRPRYALRGHQLGYRPKTNSYDAWDLPVWEQYLRDLIVFGCNAIELIPPRSDDDADSPHYPRPPMEMMVGMSRLADEYGLEVWVWYPAMDRDYADPKTVEFALREWSEVLRQLPRVDAVFVPGGDPGHTPPKPLMALLKQQTQQLRRIHPKGQMWVSPQSFNQAWLEEFLGYLKEERPDWLSGVVFGPQVRVSLPRLRALVPAQYPIRHYPDITHSRQCQYAVPDWDLAYALTEARECINPRPEGQAVIFRALQESTIGFISYSEGCNDDVNKAVWSALGWDPEMKVIDILRAYSRYFIGEDYADDFAQGLLALERNWQGPLLANAGVLDTLAQFQTLEGRASPRVLGNWRFQQALFRAYYDAYTRARLIHETDLEARAMEELGRAPQVGALPAMAAAERQLELAESVGVARAWQGRIHQLAEALFQSIRMQLSVAKYKAIAVDRGASLDTLDFPLNDRAWLKDQFAQIRQLPAEPDRLARLTRIREWTNPGPGGFYDDLGHPARQPHLVRGPGFDFDPGFFESARMGFEEDLVVEEGDEKPPTPRRLSWMDHAESLFDAPLRMHYRGLDPAARYRVRVVYAGDSPKRQLRLMANDGLELHPWRTKAPPFTPLEFEVPAQATATGELTLTWQGQPGLGGNGRGCQVSEVWLIKVPTPPTPSVAPRP